MNDDPREAGLRPPCPAISGSLLARKVALIIGGDFGMGAVAIAYAS